MIKAITRQVSRGINQCEVTHIKRQVIDVQIARRQHEEYEQVLKELGCAVIRLPEEADLPDSVFVEDTAVVLPEVAVITRPGADSRKPECDTVATALKPYRDIVRIEAPAVVDGGDVLVLDEQVYIGLSTRSNPEAVSQMRSLLTPYGYQVHGVALNDCLHLKSAVTRVSKDTLLVNKAWVDTSIFPNWKIVEIDPSEPYGANGLWINNCILYPFAFPKTRKRLEDQGMCVVEVDVSELAKAEGAVTCCSLVFEV
ncbi:MAG: hypothetical protein JXA13_01505 [Anaerolineales bacterium]|nr:hypothetical protein [Anaerolineales bacterium]